MANEADFDEFWKAYPRRIGKLAAKKAYDRARRGGVTQAELLDGVALYRQHKPGYADWAHPASWLNAGRWADEWGAPERNTPAEPIDWYAECQREHGGTCGLSQYRHALEMAKQRATL
jgi:hypothetical protein